MKLFSKIRNCVTRTMLHRIEKKLEMAEGQLAWIHAERCPLSVPLIPALETTVTTLRERRDNLRKTRPR